MGADNILPQLAPKNGCLQTPKAGLKGIGLTTARYGTSSPKLHVVLEEDQDGMNVNFLSSARTSWIGDGPSSR
eukprot:6192640-Pyramimonas_sp.AAC.1